MIIPYIKEHQIQQRITQLANEIDDHYRNDNHPLIVIGILKGSFIFMADLVRKIQHPLRTEFISVSSYKNGTYPSENIEIKLDLDFSIERKNILIIEDIIDTGNTFFHILESLKNKNPKSLKICTLLNKPSRRINEINIDFSGFEIPNEFVVGYGLDYAQNYRNLPYIGILKLD